MFTAQFLTELANIVSHTCSLRTHHKHCLICETFHLHKHNCTKPKRGLQLLPNIFPSDMDLLKTETNLVKQSTVFTNNPDQRHVIEIRLLMHASGFSIHKTSNNLESKVYFLFVDIDYGVERALQRFWTHYPKSEFNTVVHFQGSDCKPMFSELPPHTVYIRCTTVDAVREYIRYCQSMENRFTVKEIMHSGFAARSDTEIFCHANLDKRLTTVMI